jgi:hypothetical protein
MMLTNGMDCAIMPCVTEEEEEEEGGEKKKQSILTVSKRPGQRPR